MEDEEDDEERARRRQERKKRRREEREEEEAVLDEEDLDLIGQLPVVHDRETSEVISDRCRQRWPLIFGSRAQNSSASSVDTRKIAMDGQEA